MLIFMVKLNNFSFSLEEKPILVARFIMTQFIIISYILN